jgi:hypothetical protein
VVTANVQVIEKVLSAAAALDSIRARLLAVDSHFSKFIFFELFFFAVFFSMT